MKRGPAIFLMLLAIFVILAHSFIPHAHHDDHICLTGRMHQASCSLAGDHPENSCSHPNHSVSDNSHTGSRHHSGNNEPADCRLMSLLLYSPSSHKAHPGCCSVGHDGGHNTGTEAGPLLPGTPAVSPEHTLPFRQKPYLAPAVPLSESLPGTTRAPPRS